VTLAVLAGPVPALAPAAGAEGFRAGAARADITPKAALRLGGHPERRTPSEGVEEPLFARVLALEDAAGVITVLVAADAVAVPAAVRERVAGAIRSRLGIYRVRIALAATGSRSAPALEGALEGVTAPSAEEIALTGEYTSFVAERIALAVAEAKEKLGPARLLRGEGRVGFARRAGGAAGDSTLEVLAAVREGGELVAAAFLAPCEADTLPATFNRVAGDWPGRAAALLEKRHPGAVALPLIGAAAGTRPEPRGRLADAEAHGALAALVVEGLLEGGGRALAPLSGGIDAQIEYLPGSSPLQLFTFGEGASSFAIAFLPGPLEPEAAAALRAAAGGRKASAHEAGARSLWFVSRANAAAAAPSSPEGFLAERLRALLETGGGGAAAARLKPPPARSPREALESFRVEPGLRVELAASEPQVTDPVAIAFDEAGRLYAAEMRDYPLGPGPGRPFDGRVRVLEDRDRDGYFEHSSVLAAEVPYANGVACWRGGVFVTAAPDVIYVKDEDGDGRADVRQVVYTGFNLGNSQHLLNSMAFGPGGWIWVNGGDGAEIRSPRDPSLPELRLSHQSFRFDPRTLRIEATTGYRGGFGISFDEGGERFVCDNTNHVQHVVFQARDLERDPEAPVGDTIHLLSDHGGGVFPASKPLERFNDPWHAGHFSSACGVHIYLGARLPEEFRGNHFVCEPVANLVHRDVLVPAGASFTARRAREGAEFLASTDHWFRPVSCESGPDGALYIADMCREVIEHPEWIPEHVEKLFDLRSGMDRGRIWRVVPEDDRRAAPGAAAGAAPEKPSLAALDGAALAALLGDPDAWRRRTAERLLLERGARLGADTVAGLRSLLGESPEPRARLHALWTLEGLGALRPEDAARALRDASPPVRAEGARLAAALLDRPAREEAAGEETASGRRAVAAALGALAEDSEARVRFQAALALGSLAPEERAAPLARIAALDAADPWTRTAVLLAAGASVETVLARLVDAGPGPGRSALLAALAGRIGSRGELESVARALEALARAERWGEPTTLLEALRQLLGSLAPATVSALSGSARARLDGFLAFAAARAREEGAEIAERAAALEVLGHARTEEALGLLDELLAPHAPPELQLAAVRALGEVAARGDVATLDGDPLAGAARAILLGAFPRETPRLRAEILDALARGPGGAEAILRALEEGRIEARFVDPSRRQLLLETGDEPFRRRAALAFGDLAPDPDRAALVERYRAALLLLPGRGDAGRGRELYRRLCAPCHPHGDEGHAVGPDLAAMRERPADSLLEDILDPGRAVDPKYAGYVLVTRSGEALSGVLAAENPTSVVIRRGEGKSDTILRRDILELRPTRESVMPAGLEGELTPAALRDLISFLRE
jgi:putative membrane-bound dehydrogenase-like protein